MMKEKEINMEVKKELYDGIIVPTIIYSRLEYTKIA